MLAAKFIIGPTASEWFQLFDMFLTPEARANHALTIGHPDMSRSEIVLLFFFEMKLLQYI